MQILVVSFLCILNRKNDGNSQCFVTSRCLSYKYHILQSKPHNLYEIIAPKQSHGVICVYLFYSFTSSTNMNSNYCIVELCLKLAVYWDHRALIMGAVFWHETQHNVELSYYSVVENPTIMMEEGTNLMLFCITSMISKSWFNTRVY